MYRSIQYEVRQSTVIAIESTNLKIIVTLL